MPTVTFRGWGPRGTRDPVITDIDDGRVVSNFENLRDAGDPTWNSPPSMT